MQIIKTPVTKAPATKAPAEQPPKDQPSRTITTRRGASDLYYRLRNLIIRAALRVVTFFSPSISALVARIDSSPGIPVPDPCVPYWLVPPSPIATHGSGSEAVLPEYADVVIIGSGITGTAVARTLLDWGRDHTPAGKEGKERLRVVMLEARETCSGATGRNGGHINPILYLEYDGLKQRYGIEIAKKIIRFRLAHKTQLLAVAEEEGLLEDSQGREVEAFDVYHSSKFYQAAKKKLATYRADLPVESADFKVHEGKEVIKDLQLSNRTVGCLSTRAGAIHPYRLVTGILSRLLSEYSSSFHLFTHTPCTAVSSSPDEAATEELYRVTTPKGIIKTPHVIHATNGWASHLLPGMRGKIIPARGVVAALRPPNGLGDSPGPTLPDSDSGLSWGSGSESWAGTRSFVFFPEEDAHTYDYLTQQQQRPEGEEPKSEEKKRMYPPPEGEMMLGAVVGQGNSVLTELGCADDRVWNEGTGEYLKHALDRYFDVGGAKDAEKGRHEQEQEDDGKGENVKRIWGGILGVSADLKPWVGRIPCSVSGRGAPRECGPKWGTDVASTWLAAPGEWMAAGYSGEGMVHAWMSGKALAYMVLGLDKDTVGRAEKETSLEGGEDIEEWFPHVYRFSEERWERTGVEDLIAAFLMD
ncbi:putative FAD dependent oxidoreductase [Lyophyllum shimeji]|uniref:FAD dependent oxidoreductase n=1 Tax=Lyophyllum shimeji TaxID=47721 RepID=A0A9P3PIR3_LYOSH|nr:putative FAD dependent oxidoreductase [Lyophyllum shimeji]